jgi:insertion element IS1 protein InsB
MVDRDSRCIIAHDVVWERTTQVMQAIVDRAAHAARYISDGFPTYGDLCYWGAHQMMHDKSETYSVEGTNADLRHYLARLIRKSRCFSRCIDALRRAVDLFVHFYNRRQLRKRKFPRYPANVTDLLSAHL